MEDKILYNINLLHRLVVRELVHNHEKFINPQFGPSQMIIIDYLMQHKNEEVYQKDLEMILSLRRATVSGILQTMEKNGLIERNICNNDVRCKTITLKNSARETFEHKMEKFLNVENILKNGLNEEEISEFCHIISIMQDNISEYLQRKEDKNV